MPIIDTVRGIAIEMHLLDTDDRLIPLDSLAIVDFVGRLERAIGRPIPSAALRFEVFNNLQSVADMLAEIE